MNNCLKKLTETLEALARFCKFELVWKVTSSLIVEEELPLHLRCHRCNFCMNVKKNPEMRLKCIKHDTKILPTKLTPDMKYLVYPCHAGVCEVILPVTHNNTIIGAVMCGPFRSQDKSRTDKEYAALTELTPEMPELLYKIIVPLIQSLAENTYANYANSIKKHVNDERICRAVDYINANYKEKITLDSVSRICALSKSRFTHLFREQCKINFSDFLQNVRIIEAKRFLAGSNYTIAEISLICGFSTQSHFTVIFKKICGTTPQDYRRITQKTLTA